MAWKVEGLADLNKRLEALGTDVATKVGQAADRAGAVVIRDAIIAAAPDGPTEEGAPVMRRGRKVEHHKIKNSVKVKKTRNVSPTKVQTTITTTAAIQSVWEEFGSIHNKATRFMTNAVDAVAEAALAKIAASLAKRIEKKEG